MLWQLDRLFLLFNLLTIIVVGQWTLACFACLILMVVGFLLEKHALEVDLIFHVALF